MASQGKTPVSRVGAEQERRSSSIKSDTVKFIVEEESAVDPIFDLENEALGSDPIFEDVSEQLNRINDEKEKDAEYEIKLGASKYKVSEIIVRISKKVLTAQAQATEPKESWRKFNKKIILPNGVKPESTSCILSNTGIFTIALSTKTLEQKKRDAEALAAIVDFGPTVGLMNPDACIVEGANIPIRSKIMPGGVSLKPKNVDFKQLVRKGYPFEETKLEEYKISADGIFEKEVETEGYLPEEIDVSVSNDGMANWVLVEGRRGHREGTKFKARSFYKMFTLPPQADPGQMSFNFNADGVLIVRVPTN
jgi:HSP20 family molecular chaperone IbpA